MRLGEVMAYACACAAIAVSSSALGAEPGDKPGAKPADKPGDKPAADAPLPPAGEARPPPPPEAPPAPVPWNHHIEVGGGVAFAQMIASKEPTSVAAGKPQPAPIRFAPGVGFHVDLSWQIFRWLRFTGYMVEQNSPLTIPRGALAAGERAKFDNCSSPSTVPPSACATPTVHVYTFGVRASPTLSLGSRVRLWLTAGGGWGYLGYPRFTSDLQSGARVVNAYPVVRERSSTIFEIPVGLGYAIEIIPRWLSFHFEATCAFAPSQVGEALDPGQYVDASGKMGKVFPMPRLDATFVESIGLSLHL